MKFDELLPFSQFAKSHSEPLASVITPMPITSWRSERCRRIAHYSSKWQGLGAASSDACGEVPGQSCELPNAHRWDRRSCVVQHSNFSC